MRGERGIDERMFRECALNGATQARGKVRIETRHCATDEWIASLEVQAFSALQGVDERWKGSKDFGGSSLSITPVSVTNKILFTEQAFLHEAPHDETGARPQLGLGPSSQPPRRITYLESQPWKPSPSSPRNRRASSRC